MKTALDFLVRLGEHPSARAQFSADPAAALSVSNLSNFDRAAIASGDYGAACRAAGVNAASLPPKIITVPAAFAAV
ncbi:MAG: hypothetical protein H7124_04215 [Phycisphaerales bacterium]|nr:hypothetical protein [Hyphomonadaceae bacterium]